MLDLIESAEEELLFQIPYIDSYKPSAKGNLEKLVKALIRKSKQIETVHVILRSDHGTWIPCAEDLKKRGLNLDKCFRHLPSTHTKGMVVDGKRAYVGSINFTTTSMLQNREVGLIFEKDSEVKKVQDAIVADFGAGTAL